LQLGTNNGALEPGNLDLHLTNDRNAVIMGNTHFRGFSDQPSHNYPYLIERYESIERVCVDVEKKVNKRTYKTRVEKAPSQFQQRKSEAFDIKVTSVNIRSLIPCEKVSPSDSPSMSPSDSPSISPSDSPTEAPTMFRTGSPTTFQPTIQPSFLQSIMNMNEPTDVPKGPLVPVE
jgi:hypothetical protein